ncbi:MAG: ErfK/YbiS/YcfS/YnhG family protein [Acidimicrobiales bacterium]|nr:ErfK/YbiS/YcfS/YnhG family protein [Acidimicrobiales bacterium]
MRRPKPAVLAAAVLLPLVIGACGKVQRPTFGAPIPATTTTTTIPFRLVAAVKPELKTVGVYDAAGAPVPRLKLSNPTNDGVVRVFLVDEQQGPEWLRVDLPVRPNGSVGWIRSADVTLGQNYWRMEVELGAHRISVWNGADLVHTEPVGVGTAAAPTPPGEYFVTEALTVPSFQRSAYGPFAFGISGHSNVYTSFGGGDGTIGIHGTGDPSSLGKDASHGCIRLSNDGITKLIKQVPLGTPVVITA